MPLQATSGAASYDGFGGGVAAVPNYIEDVFSTWLYKGTDATQTITNGVDLSGKGGLVWVKNRISAFGHSLTDTARGTGKVLQTNNTNASQNWDDVTAFSSSGFTVSAASTGNTNSLDNTYASWTFRKQPKFFDVVTYTGNGTSQTISHNLGSTPGCIITKRLNSTSNWLVYHRSISTQRIYLNQITAATGTIGVTSVGSTSYSVNGSSELNENGGTYVAYIYAHDAGGFGLTGTDNVISCGSYTGNSSVSGPTVDLGWEPQWVMIKRSSSNNTPYSGLYDDWYIMDSMRGMPHMDSPTGFNLNANTTDADEAESWVKLMPNGFQVASTDIVINETGVTYIYIAIRRGPMKVPTSGTSVFSPNASSAATNTAITTNFPIDLQIQQYRSGSGANWYDRLRGISTTTTASGQELGSAYTGGESATTGTRLWGNTGFTLSSYTSGAPFIYWNFKRAPSFFDEVCYTGTGSATTQTHNLGVVPEMIIVKGRTNTFSWFVYQKDLTTANQSFLTLNTDSAVSTGSAVWNSTSPTSSVFSIGSANAINQSGQTYVAYLFATCAGVSKVGSYTGNGTTQTINCGFTGGARFVLIKRTDSTGDWYVYDTARGMTVLTDPYLLLNSTAAESATLGSVTTVSTGFAVNASILAAINTNGASYIFFSVA